MAYLDSCQTTTDPVMKQFLNDQQVMWLTLPDDFKPDFEGVLDFETKEHGTLSHDFSQAETNAVITDFSISSSTHSILLPSRYTRSLFNSDDMEALTRLYAEFYSMPLDGDLDRKLEIHPSFCKFVTLTINGKVYGSHTSRSKSSSIILAKLSDEIRPTTINYFAIHC